MTIGIYLLKFEGTDKVYIGQSVSVEIRYSRHKLNFNNKKSPPKLQKAFEVYGIPKLHILEECSVDSLNDLEDKYIEQYSSIENGFNSISNKGAYLAGEKAGGAKYTNEMYLDVFDLLVDTTLPIDEISKISGVSKDSIYHISNGSAHTWIKDIYPDRYQLLINTKSNRKNASHVGIFYPKLLSPNGEVIEITGGLNSFCRDNNIDASNLSKVIRGLRKTHKGWKLA